jgi:hypothetical protein
MKVKLPIIFEEDPINFLNFESIDTSDTENIEQHIDCRDFVKEEGKLYFSLVFEYLNTNNIKKSIVFANKCATQVIQKRGTSKINLKLIL